MKIEFSQYSSNWLDFRYPKDDNLHWKFFDYYIKKYIEYYNGQPINEILYREYVSSGIEGLESFAEFLRKQGFKSAVAYYLRPNSIILQNNAMTATNLRRLTETFSLSFGIEIADNESTLVEFKLVNA